MHGTQHGIIGILSNAKISVSSVSLSPPPPQLRATRTCKILSFLLSSPLPLSSALRDLQARGCSDAPLCGHPRTACVHWALGTVRTAIIILLSPPAPCLEDQAPSSCPEKNTHVEPEVGDIRGDGHVVVAHCFVDILAVFHQHTLWPHALFSPPGGKPKSTFCP